jgi:hypothetical protein
MFYLPYTVASKNVLRFNINKVLSSNQENDNLSTSRPLFDGIMFLMAYLKMWMNTHIRWKYVECLPVESESTPSMSHVTHDSLT